MPVERLDVLPSGPARQSVTPIYDSRDAYIVDLHLNEGCPNNGLVILEGAQLTATKVVSVNPVSAIPSVK